VIFYGARFILRAGRRALGRVDTRVFASTRDASQVRLAVIIQTAFLLVHSTGQLSILVHHESELAYANGVVSTHDALLKLVTGDVGSGAWVFAYSVSRTSETFVAVIVGLA
jgi:hypothetical protein